MTKKRQEGRKMSGTYSIYYERRGDSNQFALDWNCRLGVFDENSPVRKKQWTASINEGVCWREEKEKTQKMREVLLKHFGLQYWKKEYPWKKIRFMSPRDLVNERRKRERESGYARLYIKSDTLGFHIAADDYRG